MADWSLLDLEWLPVQPPVPYGPFQYAEYEPFYEEKPLPPPEARPSPAQQPHQSYAFASPSPSLKVMLSSPRQMLPVPSPFIPPPPRGDNPREIRNKAEKQRRDKLNHSISELASMVPPVVAASRKIDKTGVLRLTAHYLRAHHYVFGDSIARSKPFTASSTKAVMSLLNGFLLTVTYKGLVVVVSQNVTEYLGYSENHLMFIKALRPSNNSLQLTYLQLDLLGQNLFNLTHEDDRQILKKQLMPRSQKLGTYGELLVPEGDEGKQNVAQALANEKRRFIIRFKRLGQRSEPSKYVTCHVEGSLRKSDRACRGHNRCCQMVRRARARADNPCSSGNDVVFIGIVRPTTETFINESALESFNMEYRTRHSIDGEIIQCEQKIALVTGYMTHEVKGVNAMNFIHRDEVRWVVEALREMYEHNHLYGESCYRLVTKAGQFVYMRTRGRLDVDTSSRAVTSFICTNTVVDEREGKHLIKMMKERFSINVHRNSASAFALEDAPESVPVEDPRQLEKVIMKLVTNLPTPDFTPATSLAITSPVQAIVGSKRFDFIAPRKERIIRAIEKIYTVIKSIPKNPIDLDEPDANALSNNVGLDLNYIQAITGADLVAHSSFVSNTGTDYFQVMPYTEQKFQMFPPEDIAGLCEEMGDVPHQNFEQDIVKMSNEPVTQASGRISPSLEMFFDEAILNNQIESAINSLEQPMDPNFPDLLISNEVQEILGKIEEADAEMGT